MAVHDKRPLLGLPETGHLLAGRPDAACPGRGAKILQIVKCKIIIPA